MRLYGRCWFFLSTFKQSRLSTSTTCQQIFSNYHANMKNESKLLRYFHLILLNTSRGYAIVVEWLIFSFWNIHRSPDTHPLSPPYTSGFWHHRQEYTFVHLLMMKTVFLAGVSNFFRLVWNVRAGLPVSSRGHCGYSLRSGTYLASGVSLWPSTPLWFLKKRLQCLIDCVAAWQRHIWMLVSPSTCERMARLKMHQISSCCQHFLQIGMLPFHSLKQKSGPCLDWGAHKKDAQCWMV